MLSSIWERISQRRSVLEKERGLQAKRLRKDVHRIAVQDVKFVRRVLSEMVPIKVSVEEDACAKLSALVPVKVEVIDRSAYTSDQKWFTD